MDLRLEIIHKAMHIALTRYVLEEQHRNSDATDDLAFTMNAVARLINLVKLAGNINVQGEDQKKLDVLFDEMFVNALRASRTFSFIVSEEVDDILVVGEELHGRYCITFDPLDGSSNYTGVNGTQK